MVAVPLKFGGFQLLRRELLPEKIFRGSSGHHEKHDRHCGNKNRFFPVIHLTVILQSLIPSQNPNGFLTTE
jgi:hypothetical protein